MSVADRAWVKRLRTPLYQGRTGIGLLLKFVHVVNGSVAGFKPETAVGRLRGHLQRGGPTLRHYESLNMGSRYSVDRAIFIIKPLLCTSGKRPSGIWAAIIVYNFYFVWDLSKVAFGPAGCRMNRWEDDTARWVASDTWVKTRVSSKFVPSTGWVIAGTHVSSISRFGPSFFWV